MSFLNETIGNYSFRLSPTIAIVGENNDRQQCFSQDSLVKMAQNAQNSELLLFIKTLV